MPQFPIFNLNTQSRGDLIDFFATLGFVLVLLLLRFSIVSMVRRNPNLSIEQKRIVSVNVRNTLLIVFLLGMIAIWASQLHTLVVSLAAFAVAFVIAGKELILCFTGAILRSVGRLYEMGDRVEIGPHSGIVIDISPFSTTLAEIDAHFHQRTGRAITIPNSQLWTMTVVHDQFAGDFVLHQFLVPIADGQDWQATERLLLELACEKVRVWRDEMLATAQEMAQRYSLETRLPDPFVTLGFDADRKLQLMVHVPSRSQQRQDIEQCILRAYLTRCREVAPSTVPPAAAEASGHATGAVVGQGGA